MVFLSTLPARGATSFFRPRCGNEDISIHTPREGSDRPHVALSNKQRDFYPHSPRGERPLARIMSQPNAAFLSTLPARGATGLVVGTKTKYVISIHTPREGSDQLVDHLHQRHYHFYPHSPRGERPMARCWNPLQKPFLSTLPARGATGKSTQDGTPSPISIHTPREGSDIFTSAKSAFC